MTMLSIDALRDLAPAYVMGTLTAEELHSFEAAMRDPAIAAALADEIADYRRTVELLATTQAVVAPPTLRDRLLQRIAQEDRGAPAAVVLPFAKSSEAAATRAVKSPRGTRVWAGIFTTALAASVVFSINVHGERESLQAGLAAQRAKVEQLQAKLALRDATVQILTESGSSLRLVQLVANTAAGPAMQVYWNVKNGTAVLHASGLSPVPKNRAYALWMIRGGVPVPLTLFTPDRDGHRLINLAAFPTSTDGVAAFAVTEEPAEGSPAPTMTPFLVGTVPLK